VVQCARVGGRGNVGRGEVCRGVPEEGRMGRKVGAKRQGFSGSRTVSEQGAGEVGRGQRSWNKRARAGNTN
jgi:hypothetical protein